MAATSFDRHRVLREGIGAYGPLAAVVGIGALAGMVPLWIFGIVQAIMTNEVTVTGNVVWSHVYIPPAENVVLPALPIQPIPIFVFLALGALLAAIARLHRQAVPSPALPWEVIVGIPLFTSLGFFMTSPALPVSSFEHGLILWSWMLPAGLLVCYSWAALFWLALTALASHSWEDTSEAIANHLVKLLGIPKARLFAVKADSTDRTLVVRGSLSRHEAVRLQAGLLDLVENVKQLEVFCGSKLAQTVKPEFTQFSALNQAKREVALARLNRKNQVPEQRADSLRLSRYETFWQSHRSGHVPILGMVLIAFVVGLSLWAMNLVRPLQFESLESQLRTYFGYERSQAVELD